MRTVGLRIVNVRVECRLRGRTKVVAEKLQGWKARADDRVDASEKAQKGGGMEDEKRHGWQGAKSFDTHFAIRV